MVELKNIKSMLGKNSNQLEVLFISLDPERDTQELLSAFIPSFDSSFIGLTGTIENIEKIEVDQIKNEMLKNFYNESKKVSNKKMKSYFNYNLKFPSYIEGLNHIRSNFI